MFRRYAGSNADVYDWKKLELYNFLFDFLLFLAIYRSLRPSRYTPNPPVLPISSSCCPDCWHSIQCFYVFFNYVFSSQTAWCEFLSNIMRVMILPNLLFTLVINQYHFISIGSFFCHKFYEFLTIVGDTKIGPYVPRPALLTPSVTHGFSTYNFYRTLSGCRAYCIFPIVNLLRSDVWNSN